MINDLVIYALENMLYDVNHTNGELVSLSKTVTDEKKVVTITLQCEDIENPTAEEIKAWLEFKKRF